VREGDDLWKIAEAAYKDGYKWVEVAKANNITDPGMISAGQKLTLPQVTTTTVAQNPTPTTVVTPAPSTSVPAGQKITGITYTVVHGDDLWDIAVRAYGDGYKWVEIARANNLTNPNIIHSGNVFKLPR
jgi:nucleoid-associated protein YgaU